MERFAGYCRPRLEDFLYSLKKVLADKGLVPGLDRLPVQDHEPGVDGIGQHLPDRGVMPTLLPAAGGLILSPQGLGDQLDPQVLLGQKPEDAPDKGRFFRPNLKHTFL
ncbi:MAG: hypothetical protein ABII00_09095 [Elusimicrobiota bacterium]